MQIFLVSRQCAMMESSAQYCVQPTGAGEGNSVEDPAGGLDGLGLEEVHVLSPTVH